MKNPQSYSPQAVEAARLLGTQVRLARLERRWTIDELAERTGVSHNTIKKVERGDMTVAMGTALEAAVLVGLPLFSPDPQSRYLQVREADARLSLLPARVRRPEGSEDVDF